ncbi:hypothetical protein [Streptomyces catenulae]|uniref:Tyr recombinase domain-containing protein n=1 Tax=Streptomyces catenulae TaxID=66875 RepID=A0ABV2Z3Z2_9ACTN|nr:hypothetical protein [Streptomyces catenulae]
MHGAILGYQPPDEPAEWPLVAEGVRQVAAATCNSVPYPVPQVMLVLSGLAAFAERAGLKRDPLVWLASETITRYLLAHPSLRGGTLQMYRSIFLRVREALLWLQSGQQAAPKMQIARRSAPYTPPELARFMMWARNLPGSAARGGSALTLLALGAGCGFSRREVLAARGNHVTTLPSDTVVVAVPDSDRLVVCRAMWEKVLAERALSVGHSYLFLPQREATTPKNCIANWVERTQEGSPCVPKLKLSRLRSTWIVELLRQHVPDDVIAAAAGMSSTAGLAPYRAWVSKPTQKPTTCLLQDW